MKRRKHKKITKTVFRTFKDNGEVIALFPEIYDSKECIGCYSHNGQHGGANYKYIISVSKLSTIQEYEPLKMELENSYRYNIKVLKRAKINWNKLLKNKLKKF